MISNLLNNSPYLQTVFGLPQEFLPKIFFAFLVLLIGFFLAYLLQAFFTKIFGFLNKINDVLDKIEFFDSIKKAGINLDFGKFLGVLVKIFVVLIALIIAFDILGFQTLNNFLLNEVLEYIPNVFIATAVLIFGIIFANWIYSFIVKISKVTKVSGSIGASVAKYSILVFAIFIALAELGIAPGILQSIVIGFITAISLAIGLAFGLGGQETAAKVLENIRKDFNK